MKNKEDKFSTDTGRGLFFDRGLRFVPDNVVFFIASTPDYWLSTQEAGNRSEKAVFGYPTCQ